MDFGELGNEKTQLGLEPMQVLWHIPCQHSNQWATDTPIY